jgi:hypothetical protein
VNPKEPLVLLLTMTDASFLGGAVLTQYSGDLGSTPPGVIF